MMIKMTEVMFRKFFGPQSEEAGGGNPASHEMLLAALEEAVSGAHLGEAAAFLEGDAGRQHVSPLRPSAVAPVVDLHVC